MHYGISYTKQSPTVETVALFSFQHLQCITPELMIHTAVRLFDAMSAEERILLQKKMEAEGKLFPIDDLRHLANHIAE